MLSYSTIQKGGLVMEECKGNATQFCTPSVLSLFLHEFSINTFIIQSSSIIIYNKHWRWNVRLLFLSISTICLAYFFLFMQKKVIMNCKCGRRVEHIPCSMWKRYCCVIICLMTFVFMCNSQDKVMLECDKTCLSW